MAKHIWGGAEMRTPEGKDIHWKPREEPTCPPAAGHGGRGKRSWFRGNKGRVLTLANIALVLVVALVFLNLPNEHRSEPVRGAWTLQARFFADDKDAFLSLEFSSPSPVVDSFELRVGENERTLQSLTIHLEAHSPQIIRKKLSFLPSGGTVDLWIGNNRVRAPRG